MVECAGGSSRRIHVGRARRFTHAFTAVWFFASEPPASPGAASEWSRAARAEEAAFVMETRVIVKMLAVAGCMLRPAVAQDCGGPGNCASSIGRRPVFGTFHHPYSHPALRAALEAQRTQRGEILFEPP